jgi:hypothetical protein
MTPSDPDFGPRRPDEFQFPTDAAPPEPDAAAVEIPLPEVSPVPPRVQQASLGRLFIERIATHNPLYAISAALVCYGLQVSFPASDVSGYAPKLAVSLAAYVVLLTGVAIGLRRLGTLWQDLRMIGLLVVLLLPMISVTLDETLIAAPSTGRLWEIVGGAFAAVIGEALLFGLRVRLPLWYRLPYHLLMTLFFAYTLLFATSTAGASVDPHDAMLQWKLFGFAQAGAAILLIGLIAILKGPAYVSQNGTPWRWPLYPTVIFGFLIVCLAGRSYYLSRSFHPIGERESIFGPYFLVPLVLVIGVLTFVAGLRNRSPIARNVGLAIPWLALWMTEVEPGRDPFYSEFLHRFQAATGALPPLAALWIAVGIYGVAAVCRVRWSIYHLVTSLILMAYVGPTTTSLLDRIELADASHWTMLLAAALLLARGLRRRETFDALLGTICVLLFVDLLGRRIAWFPTGFVGYHAVLAVVLPIGILWGEKRGYWLRLVSALMLIGGLTAWHYPHLAPLFARAPWALQWWYPVGAIAITAGAALVTRDRIFRDAAAWMIGIEVLYYGKDVYLWARRYVAGIGPIVLGLFSLAAAVWVSVRKMRREVVTACAAEASGGRESPGNVGAS